MLQMEREASMSEKRAMLSAVSDALWTQRDILQTLLYRLVCENLLLTSGSTHWLPRADDDVRAAVEQLRGGEVIRAAEVEELTRILGFDPDASLADLAVVAPEPWRTMLIDHRTALRSLTTEVHAVAEENRQLLEAASQAVAAVLAEQG
jgi:hypothetical protein